MNIKILLKKRSDGRVRYTFTSDLISTTSSDKDDFARDLLKAVLHGLDDQLEEGDQTTIYLKLDVGNKPPVYAPELMGDLTPEELEGLEKVRNLKAGDVITCGIPGKWIFMGKHSDDPRTGLSFRKLDDNGNVVLSDKESGLKLNLKPKQLRHITIVKIRDEEKEGVFHPWEIPGAWKKYDDNGRVK